MKLPFFHFAPRRRRSQILRVSGNAFALCCPADGNSWKLHYLLRGSFGNYLLGGPPFDRAFADIAYGMGGIARVLPFEVGLAEGAGRWFTRFGCRWAAPVSEERISPGPVPVDAVDCLAFSGLREVHGYEGEGGYGWRFRWREAVVVAGFAPYATAQAPPTLVLAHSVVGSERDLGNAVVSMQSALSNALPSEWLQRLGAGHPLLCVAFDRLGLIACFDDIEYERNDVEIIGPRQRRQLADLLGRHGFVRLSPHCYRHRDVVVRIAEPPRTQMSEPLNGLGLERGAITLVTATQAAFEILLANWPVERRLEALRRLVTHLPVNLRKIDTALKRRPELVAGHDPERLLARWRGLQAVAVAYYKPRRPRGLHGRLFEPGAGHAVTTISDEADA